jgi:LmbE family N-acetylglucosaminyl deacetylase
MLERVLVIAPHPDDDAIACGGLLQRATEARVVYVTDGERNPWPQRVHFRTPFINAGHRARWGAMRREEARCSLSQLGIDSTRFLAFPDQGLMASARRGDLAPRDALMNEIRDFAPTLIVSPSSFDAHYDHRAIAWYLGQTGVSVPHSFTYVIHGAGPRSREALTIELTREEQARKLAAIRCHQSQLLLSEKRFLSYATEREVFYRAEHDLVRIESSFESFVKRARHAWLTYTGRR